MFPLKYTKQPDEKLRVEFSGWLFVKCLVVMMFLTSSSYFALYKDYKDYLAGRPVRMTTSTSALAVAVDVVVLNLMAVFIFYSVTSNYPALREMCTTLESIDETLQLKTHHPWLRFKILIVFVHLTGLISVTTVVRFKDTPDIALYIPFWTTYYIVGTSFLQFHCVVQTLTERFKAINVRIEEEVMKQTFEHLLIADLGLSQSSASFGGSAVCRLKALLHCYGELHEAVGHADSYFRGQVLVTVSTSLFHNVISLYFLFLDLQQSALTRLLYVQFVWALSRLAHIVLLLLPSASLCDAAEETGPVVCQLLTRDLFSLDVTEELKMFSLKLRHYRLQFSALGFFPIHRNILTSIASSVATYLVVMLQLEDSSDSPSNYPASNHKLSNTD